LGGNSDGERHCPQGTILGNLSHKILESKQDIIRKCKITIVAILNLVVHFTKYL